MAAILRGLFLVGDCMRFISVSVACDLGGELLSVLQVTWQTEQQGSGWHRTAQQCYVLLSSYAAVCRCM
jgi:hypothetical protein